jgi:hypothetical protein
MLTSGRMSACARAAPKVSNTANSSVSLVSGFCFFILLNFLSYKPLKEGVIKVPDSLKNFRRPFTSRDEINARELFFSL